MRSAKSRQAMKPFDTRPVKRPVLRITSRATRSAFSTAQRSPIGPPQSCTTTVASRRSSASSSAGHVLDVAVVGVPAAVGRLVRAAEAGVVGADHALPGRHQRRQHLAVEVGPGRLAVEADDRVALALVHVVQPQAVDVVPVRLEVVARQAVEALVGSAEDLGPPAQPILGSAWRTGLDTRRHARARRLPAQRAALGGGRGAGRSRLQRDRQGDRRPAPRARAGRGRGEHLPHARAARPPRTWRGAWTWPRASRATSRSHPSGEHHHHIVCDRCGEVDAVRGHGPRAGDRAVWPAGVDYAVDAHDVTLRGECPTCHGARP